MPHQTLFVFEQVDGFVVYDTHVIIYISAFLRRT